MNSPAETAAPLRLWATAVILKSSEPGKIVHVVGYCTAVDAANAKRAALEDAQKKHPECELVGVTEQHIPAFYLPPPIGC